MCHYKEYISANDKKCNLHTKDIAYLFNTLLNVTKQLLPDFDLLPRGPVAEAFLRLGIQTMYQATAHITHLPYGRNADKNRPVTVLTDCKGTCSTKHALLYLLAAEHDIQELQLTLGIFNMNGQNTPPVLKTLTSAGLDYIPEAHVYLKYRETILDYTHPGASSADFCKVLFLEKALLPQDIGAEKIRLHRNFLEEWLSGHPDIPYSISELWKIREQCIQDLAG